MYGCGNIHPYLYLDMDIPIYTLCGGCACAYLCMCVHVHVCVYGYVCVHVLCVCCHLLGCSRKQSKPTYWQLKRVCRAVDMVRGTSKG